MTSATDPYPHAPEAAQAAPAADRAASSPPPAETGARPGKPPRWSLPALVAIMVLAGVLYSWNLSSSSLNSFYSAAVLSGTQSWKAWFFGSLDAGNFLTVDKPPVVLMVMGLSCRVFGYGTWQMMLPLVASALGTIWILHASVKRVWGHGAAAVAALVLALTPITVAINRDNNPDTLLVFLMVAGAALALRAVHNGRLLPLVGSAVCFGLAFNTKMLQGYIALPAVFAVYLYAARGGLLRRVRNLAVAAVALAVSSFWWAAAVSLVPAADRPYIGGSTDGTAWNLIMGYNGLGRVLGGEGNGGGGGGGGFSGTAGIGRMFNEVLGGQISWLLPFTTIALVGGLVLRGRAPRTDLTRAALVLWGGWTALHYLTFSLAEGTMHPYYTTALAPGIAALCGGGGLMLLHAFRTDRKWLWVLPVAFAATGIWAVVLLRRASGWNSWLWPTVAAVMVLAIVGLLLFRSGRRVRLLAVALTAAVTASLAGPTAYAASVTASSGGGMSGTNPTAGPTTGGGMGGGPGGGGGGGRGGFPGGRQAPGGQQQGGQQAGGEAPGGGQTGTPPNGTSGTGEQGGDATSRPGGTGGGGGMGGGPGGADSAMVTYLEKHRDGAKWLVAVSSSQSAAQLIVSTKQPVISMWGWSGSDKAMTLTKLKELVKKSELHYIVLGGGMGGGGGGMGGGDSASSEVTSWVQEHATAVKASEYSNTSSESSADSDSSNSSDSQNTQALYRLDASDVN
ncbi:4-amino-4-deoxy-L-arabinose transferase-like glycosyltransferase [Streptomyces phaeochromogenes]|uniref:ArnT family glycosyltransferase n=1 Tax=Streptomyces phaeochromogenes TaxID=1923 RepID=UPI002794EDF4|nr:glycosyltransferase family 39 protein [Streptomyces phaeochromogenes]MDQ0952327.1 4-amino-4-deoxy-L-arabinose transferase-like glycosyltransferase [Streptomyces phaeochromogenes]